MDLLKYRSDIQVDSKFIGPIPTYCSRTIHYNNVFSPTLIAWLDDDGSKVITIHHNGSSGNKTAIQTTYTKVLR